MGRKPLSKGRRFDVFKRDLFTCQYCGRTPPAVVLEVDHVVPVVEGGSSEDHNLITACFDCNRGKAAGSLKEAPIDVEGRRARLAERLDQTRAYEALLSEKRDHENEGIDEVIAVYEAAFEGWTLMDKTRPSIRRFLDALPRQSVLDAMELACGRMSHKERVDSKSATFRYFCGICWNLIRDGQQ